ncbi:futalosine hydrolase [Desulfobaculum bizertense]|uniref:Futalosine hydrolase n=1 Tax=Desulfobaculum bizertense DSM 18034 TaxID=1121442 RepID=A0A1T4WSA8_9BACT|nr:futalosine hydrolase [Desulfobaculum bizertense]SKA80262.1 futalosine hydrolase [Desulfobaculum bizertense DSM 18034]
MLLCVFATDKECAAALPEMHTVPAQGQWLPHVRANHELTVLITGVGPLNAAMHLGRCLATLGDRPAGVINCGLAGAFDTTSHRLGSLCIAAEEINPEYGLYTPDGLVPDGLGFAQYEQDEQRVFDRIQLEPYTAATAMGLSLPQGWPLCPMLSVAGVSGTAERAQEMQTRYPHAMLENMEGFALALSCLHESIPFLELRSVSNKIGSREKADWNIVAGFSALGRAMTMLLEA